MSKPQKSVYARLASRFAHLALGAKEDEDETEEEKKAREDKECKRAKEEEEKKAKEEEEARRANADEEDGDDEKTKKARTSERSRWAAVLSSAEAKGRVPLACSLLADTDMNADAIRSALLASPVEGRQGLAARMAAVPRPDVGSGSAATPQPGNRVAEMKSAYDMAVGR